MCSSELRFMDTDTGELFMMNFILAGTVNITFNYTQQLRDNHRYDLNIVASNGAGSNTSNDVLSKNGIG